MTREEVFFAPQAPPYPPRWIVKIGMKNDGRITAARAELRYQGGAFPNHTVEFGAQPPSPLMI